MVLLARKTVWGTNRLSRLVPNHPGQAKCSEWPWDNLQAAASAAELLELDDSMTRGLLTARAEVVAA